MTSGEPRAWEKVLTRLESDLLDGSLQPGQRLPGERQLAAELGVGRPSVREALRVLEAMGLLRAQTGSGPDSGAIIVARPSGGMSMMLRLQVAARAFPVGDVVRTRRVLESEVVRTLASAQPPVDLTEARGLLDSMDDPALSAEEFLLLDAQFHVSLANAAGNQVIAAMMGGLRASIESYVLAGLPALDWPVMCGRLAHEHRSVVVAVEACDPDLAVRRIAAHIDGYYRESGLAEG